MGRTLRVPIGTLVSLIVLTCGCSKAQPKLAPVQGTVYYKGEPLAGGTVVFAPDPERGGSGPMATAVIGKDGTFRLQTGNESGATPGWHRVTVAAEPSSNLPRHYWDPDLSGQCHEIKAGVTNVVDLRLE